MAYSINDISAPKLRALARAAKRERGNICPIVDVRARGAAEQALIDSLIKRGLAWDDNGAPRITDKGRERVRAECEAQR